MRLILTLSSWCFPLIKHLRSGNLTCSTADTFLVNETVVQGVYSRTPNFDGSTNNHILTVEKVAKLVKSPSAGLWLNVQVIIECIIFVCFAAVLIPLL